MKILKVWIVLSALILGTVSCSQDDRSGEIASLQDRIRQIEKENEELKNLNGETGLVTEPPQAEYSNDFLKNFCSYVGVDDPTELLKSQIENANYIQYYVRILQNLKTEMKDCDYQKMVFYDHPFDVAEYKTDTGYLYVQVTYSPQFKVRRFVPLTFDYQVDMSLHHVETQDGEKLTTWKIQRSQGAAKKGAIFLRTPYMVYGGVIAQSYLALYFDKILILQANRGSHNSTGEFKWLDPVNIEDSRDTLDWIVKQPRSNGRVMAYGVSYDGYDALASAATNHPALKSVVACSAPANAATDSFTSSQFVEGGIFSYVTTDRRTQTASQSGFFWEFIKTDVSKLGRTRMDDVLLGFDAEEWNATSRAIDNKDDEYWQERQLLDVLLKAKMPIAHVAGLVRDQDGRDTLLAFDHIDQNSPFKEQNYLVLHKEGHGCGDFWSAVPLSKRLMGLIEEGGTFNPSSEKRFARYLKKDDAYFFTDNRQEIPVEMAAIAFSETIVLEDQTYQGTRDPNLYSKRLAVTIEEDLVINGAPKIRLATRANVPEVPLHIHFYFIDPDGNAVEGAYGWRTGMITEKVGEPEMTELTFHLINATVPKGSQMIVELSTYNERVFLRQPATRSEDTEPEDEPSKVEIFSDEQMKTELLLPVEKGNEPDAQLPL